MRRMAVVLGVLALALGPMASARAEAPSAYGWWWEGNQRQLRPIEVPPPAFVPEDGMYVARDAVDAFAMAAMNYLAPEGPGATLQLKIAEGSQTGTPLIAACPLTADFFPEHGGTWENRPVPNCDLALTTGEDLGDGTILWHLSAEFMVSPEYWNFVLIPDEQANPFQVAFEAPDETSFSVNAGGGFTEETPPPAPPPDFGGGSDFGGGTDFSSPSTGGFGDFPPTTGTIEPTPEPQPTPPPQEDDVQSAGALPEAPDDTTDRIVAALVFAGILGALVLAARQSGVPVLAGFGKASDAPDTPRQRGLGRFAKPREGRPRGLL